MQKYYCEKEFETRKFPASTNSSHLTNQLMDSLILVALCSKGLFPSLVCEIYSQEFPNLPLEMLPK